MIVSTGDHVFAADHAHERDQGYPCHTLELITSGSMDRRTGVQPRFRPQQPWSLVLTPPEMPFRLRGRSAGRELWAIFAPREELLRVVEWPVGPHGVPQLYLSNGPERREIVATFAEAHRFFVSGTPVGQALAENALERVLLLASSLDLSARETPLDERVQQAVDLLQRGYRQPLRVADIASAVGLSASRLAHLFRSQVGQPPMHFLEQLRLEQSQHLLVRSNLTIKEVAWQVGFEDPNHFATRFRCRFGVSPTQWRQQPSARRLG